MHSNGASTAVVALIAVAFDQISVGEILEDQLLPLHGWC
jgi:hypothetical protein